MNEPRTTTQAPPLYPIRTDDEARAMLHGAGASMGEKVLRVTVPDTTPLYDLIRAGERLGYATTDKSHKVGARFCLVMERPTTPKAQDRASTTQATT
jgi:hypothetical protein